MELFTFFGDLGWKDITRSSTSSELGVTPITGGVQAWWLLTDLLLTDNYIEGHLLVKKGGDTKLAGYYCTVS